MANTDSPMKKRLKLQSSSDKDYDPLAAEDATVEIEKWKQHFEKSEIERKKLTQELSAERDKVRNAERRMEKLERDLKEKDEVAKEAKVEAAKMNKMIESLNLKHSNLELEKEKLLAKAKAGSSSGSQGGSDLPQSIKDTLQELAETELQCAVCYGVFMEATTINCGHTFCKNCIHEWQKKKSNCPVCRTDIKHMVAVKTMDNFVDKIYVKSIPEDILNAMSVIRIQPTKDWHNSMTTSLPHP